MYRLEAWRVLTLLPEGQLPPSGAVTGSGTPSGQNAFVLIMFSFGPATSVGLCCGTGMLCTDT